MLKKLSFFVALAAIIGGCKKNDTTPTDITPLTVGSNWTYLSTTAGVSSTYKYTVTNKDTLINNNTYKVVSNTAGSNVYFAKRGTDYFRIGIIPTGLSSGVFDELYIKDDLALNTTWQLTAPVMNGGTTYNSTFTYKATQLNITKTAGGKSYDGVTDIRLDITITLPAPLNYTISIGGGDFFYARGIGLISSTIAISIPGQTSYAQQIDLQSYEIK